MSIEGSVGIADGSTTREAPQRERRQAIWALAGGKGGAGDKIEAMRSCGIAVADSPASLGSTLAELLGT